VDIIAKITAWINEKDPAKALPVYWLTGLAGLGKTTIAYTVCKLLNEACLPFGSFFCSRQLDSKNSKLLVPTLCRDLAELDNSYAATVLSILETNSKVVDAGLHTQLDELLAKPWQASIAQRKGGDAPTPIVIVDALDESDRGTEFLEELLRVIRAGQLAGIKFLVTSRLDPKIVDLCKSFPQNAVCKLHEVDTANVQNDIEMYLREALPELKDEPELALLSQRAGGLFIYATTAVRFISPPHSPPSVSEMRSLLQAMLDPDSLTSHADSDERLVVDELYEQILGDAFREARFRATRLRILHTIVCAESNINVSALADLTKTDQGTVERVVESLHAVLFVSPKDGCVYWYHASFPDFVFSQVRARIGPSLHRNYQTHQVIDVFCNGPAHHGALAKRCFSVMHESLHFNMCNLRSSYVFDSEVPGLNSSIDKTFSPTFRYSSRHWARHLLRAVLAKNDTDDLICDLKDFLRNKLLFWIEAMSLIGAKFECSLLLKDAECWVERVRTSTTIPSRIILMHVQGKEWPDLLGQLADAANFSAFFAGSPASKSTPHLYISALSMWNQDSPIRNDWRDRFRFIPSISLPRIAITIPLLTIHMTGCICIALSPDGNQIVSGSEDGSVRVWDGKTEQLRELQGHTGSVYSVACSSDGIRIVSGSEDKSVRVWDGKTGELLIELQGHIGSVRSVAFSPDGNRIVSGSEDTTVRVWDAKTGGLLDGLKHTASVDSVALSSDGNRIVYGSWDGLSRVWDTKADRIRVEMQVYTGSVRSVAFSPDGNRIVSGYGDNSVHVWDGVTGDQLRELQGHTQSVDSVAFSSDGNRIVSGSRDQSVRVWDAKTGEQLRELQGHTGWVHSVAFSSDGNRIVSGSRDNSVRVWDAKMGEQLRELQGHTSLVSSADKLVPIWDGKQPRKKQRYMNTIASVAFSPDGNRIVSGSADKSVRVWDAKTGEQLRELQGHTGYVTSVAFSPDGNRIVSGSWDKSVRVWDGKTGEQLRELQGHTRLVFSVAFSSDGDRVVSGSEDSSVRVWDAKTGEQLRKLQGHTGPVHSVSFSSDGNRIVSGSWDSSVRVWDGKTGEQLRELRGHVESVYSVSFSPNDNQIVSGSEDSLVWVWDANTGELLIGLQGHTGPVQSVAFSPNGNQIVSGSQDKSVRVWDGKTGEQLRELQGHTGWVHSVAFSSDGNQVVSGSDDCSVRVWADLNLDPSWIMNEDGWILSGKKRLVWMPSTICDVLLHPYNMLTICPNGSATISFMQCKLGTFWHKCYTP